MSVGQTPVSPLDSCVVWASSAMALVIFSACILYDFFFIYNNAIVRRNSALKIIKSKKKKMLKSGGIKTYIQRKS